VVRITLIQGHPDPAGGHFCHALAQAYSHGASAAGHEVQEIDIARLDFPVLRSKGDWESPVFPEAIRRAQGAIELATHLVIVYPLWLGAMPALLKAFLEQALRPGFAIASAEGAAIWDKLLAGRSARIVVTMGMPALVYRWYFGAHSLKSLERNILGFVGIKPVRETLIGAVETCGSAQRRKWLDKLTALGQAGQ
jgi:putative NADPH-quinone reductase